MSSSPPRSSATTSPSTGPDRSVPSSRRRRDRAGGPEEDSLLLQVAAGDQAAFGELFDRLAGPVYSVARGAVGDPARAQEVAQGVLLEVWRIAGRFDPTRSAAGAWVLTLAHHRALEQIRGHQAEGGRKARSEDHPVRRPRGTGTEQLAQADPPTAVAAALTTLSPVDREALQLACDPGYSYRRAAEVLDLSPATFATRIRDALRQLRDVFAAEPQTPRG